MLICKTLNPKPWPQRLGLRVSEFSVQQLGVSGLGALGLEFGGFWSFEFRVLNGSLGFRVGEFRVYGLRV